MRERNKEGPFPHNEDNEIIELILKYYEAFIVYEAFLPKS